MDRAIGLINLLYLKVDLCFKCMSFSLSHFVFLYKKGSEGGVGIPFKDVKSRRAVVATHL